MCACAECELRLSFLLAVVESWPIGSNPLYWKWTVFEKPKVTEEAPMICFFELSTSTPLLLDNVRSSLLQAVLTFPDCVSGVMCFYMFLLRYCNVQDVK